MVRTDLDHRASLVVVEEDEDVSLAAGGFLVGMSEGDVGGVLAFLPGAGAGGPGVEELFAVAAAVEVFVAVEADVDEVCGDVVDDGEAAGGV